MIAYKKSAGFALLQVLVIAMLLFSFMYAFTRLNQTKQKHIDQQNSGRMLTIIVNALTDNTVNQNKCADGKTHALESCIDISLGTINDLKAMGIDTSTATVVVTDVRDD